MKKKALGIFISVLLFTITLPTVAQSLTPYRGKVDNGYNFWLYRPADTTTAKPVVIFLHGSSLCGNDLNSVRKYGTIDAIEKGRKIDAYVIAPQNPGGGGWKPDKINRVLDWVTANNNVDTTRIYVLGMSLGGYGTINFATTYPDKVAAAMALCGGGTKSDYTPLTKVPLWIIHGTADNIVNVKESDRVVEAMKNSKGGAPRLHYDRIDGMNHSLPARIFYMVECYEWLFSHSLSDEGRPVTPKYEISNEALAPRTVYRGTSSQKREGLIVNE